MSSLKIRVPRLDLQSFKSFVLFPFSLNKNKSVLATLVLCTLDWYLRIRRSTQVIALEFIHRHWPNETNHHPQPLYDISNRSQLAMAGRRSHTVHSISSPICTHYSPGRGSVLVKLCEKETKKAKRESLVIYLIKSK